MSSKVVEQIEELFAQREHLAEDIIINKQTVVDLDRKRNGNREGLNQIKKNLKDKEKKVWLNFGDMFIRLPTNDAQEIIEQDQNTLNEKIDQSRKIIKEKANELQQLEGKKGMQGFDLEGMTAKELYNI
ncbi:p53 and DNA damage-regulated protein 1-like protein [Cunninghamella echinulata]|nr:p53 and DNA damage-regulated protein 1-like protein [Cunninghamella echinulata]